MGEEDVVVDIRRGNISREFGDECVDKNVLSG